MDLYQPQYVLFFLSGTYSIYYITLIHKKRGLLIPLPLIFFLFYYFPSSKNLYPIEN